MRQAMAKGRQGQSMQKAAMLFQPVKKRLGPLVAGLVGLAFGGGYLYVGNSDSLVRFEYQDGDLAARGAPEKLLDLNPAGRSISHNNLRASSQSTRAWLSAEATASRRKGRRL
jgi:hypothetical protein